MSTTVVIPTFNEAECIEAILTAVLHEAPGVDILVVDDGSPDGTAALVAGHPSYGIRVSLLERAEKSGLGSAYRAGFGWALRHGYDVVVQMDADFSHPPAAVRELVAALEVSDVAIGSRYVPGGVVLNWPASRRFISWAGNTYVRVVLGMEIRDATAGFRAFRSSAVVRLGILASESNGYCFQIENAWRASRSALRVTEVPITFTDRSEGVSKMTGAIAREAVLRVLSWRWHELTRPSMGGPVAGKVAR